MRRCHAKIIVGDNPKTITICPSVTIIGHEGCLCLLLDRGADAHAKVKVHSTLVLTLQQRGLPSMMENGTPARKNEGCLRLLLQNGADVNAKDDVPSSERAPPNPPTERAPRVPSSAAPTEHDVKSGWMKRRCPGKKISSLGTRSRLFEGFV